MIRILSKVYFLICFLFLKYNDLQENMKHTTACHTQTEAESKGDINYSVNTVSI